MEEIETLINQAQLAGSADDATRSLSSAFELIFRRFKDVPNNNNNNNQKKEAEQENNFELLETYFENLMEFEFSRFLAVKKFVIEMIGEICALKPKFLLESLPVLLRFIDDSEHSALVKSSVICANNLMRPLLFFLNSDQGEELTMQSIWTDFNNIKEKLISKLDSKPPLSGPILHQVLRFLESVVLAYSFPNSQPHADSKDPPFNLYYVWKEHQDHPNKQSLLTVSDLQADAEETFKVLVLQLGKQITSSTLVVLINIFGQIGKERHTFLKLILPTLRQIQQETLKTFTGSHISSIQHAVKAALMLFMKSKTPSEFIFEIQNLFELLGAADVGTKLKHKYYPHMKRSGGEPSDPRALAKKFKEERDEPQEEQITSSISEAGQNLINLLLAANFTPTMISDLILENMKALPPAPPSNVVISLSAEVSKDLFSLLQIMVEQIEHISATTTFEPHMIQMGPDQMLEERNAAFIRILESEKELTVEGKNPFRIKVLSKLATLYDLSDPICSQLFSHILQNFPERKQLALSWIESEHQLANDSMTRYNSILLKFLKNLKAILEPNDKLLTYLIMEAPILTKEAFKELQTYIYDEPFTKMGLTTLKDIIYERPQNREDALDLLLNFTASPEEHIRAAATRLTTNKLYEADKAEEDFSLIIESFAINLFEEAQATDPSSDSEEFSRRLLLYFVLCTRKISLINRILETFAATQNPSLKKAILTQSVKLIRTIGQTQELCDIIANFPKKSEPLVLNFLHILTEKEAPSPTLVAVVKNIYHKKLDDPRFLISIIPALDKNEILKHLPKFMSLPSNITKTVITTIINRSNSISPSELMIQFHLLEKEGVALKAIMDAVQVCFDQSDVFKQDVLAIVIQQLISRIPIPQLFMRTVMMTVSRYKGLTDFVMDILSQLLNKKIWNDKNLWEGFVKCCKLTLPQSLPVVAQIPAQHLDSVWKLSPDLYDAFKQYKNQ